MENGLKYILFGKQNDQLDCDVKSLKVEAENTDGEAPPAKFSNEEF